MADPAEPKPIPVRLKLSRLPRDTSGDQSTLLGTVEINGTPHHLEFIKVAPGPPDDGDKNHETDRYHAADEGQQTTVDMLLDFWEGNFATTRVDGLEGEYVVWMHPFDA